MVYTIGQVSKMVNLPTTTLRFYESSGLLPEVNRNPSGQRVFTAEDLARLDVIECLKNSGMQLTDVKRYIDCCLEGDGSLEERLELIKAQAQQLREHVRLLQKSMESLRHMICYYEEALAAGTEAALQGKSYDEVYAEVKARKQALKQ